jgi:hypothetical protein
VAGADVTPARPPDAGLVANDVRNDPVIAPDQRKPGNRRLAYTGALVVAAILLLLLLDDHASWVEIVYVCLFSGALVLAVVVDWQLRRRGLRR